MLKTHEKSRFEVMNGNQIVKTSRIVVQIAEEKLYTNGSRMACFLCETVDPADYDRETAEGRALEAQKCLQDEIASHKEEMDEAEAKIAALEEMLAQARDERDKAREDARQKEEENTAFYGALVECERIFGSLPPEIERLYKDEAERGYK